MTVPDVSACSLQRTYDASGEAVAATCTLPPRSAVAACWSRAACSGARDADVTGRAAWRAPTSPRWSRRRPPSPPRRARRITRAGHRSDRRSCGARRPAGAGRARRSWCASTRPQARRAAAPRRSGPTPRPRTRRHGRPAGGGPLRPAVAGRRGGAARPSTAARRTAALRPGRTGAAQALAAVASAEAQYAAARAQAQRAVRRFNAGIGSLADGARLPRARRSACRPGRRSLLARRTVEALVVRAPISGRVASAAAAAPGGSAPARLLRLAARDVAGARPSSCSAAERAAQRSAPRRRAAPAVGTPVSAGDLLLTITDVSTLSLTAEVDETDVLLVKPGVRGRGRARRGAGRDVHRRRSPPWTFSPTTVHPRRRVLRRADVARRRHARRTGSRRRCRSPA